MSHMATALVATALMAVSIPARAQVFADLKSALVDYSKADIEPHKSCESLGNFKSKEIAQIHAAKSPSRQSLPLTAESPACSLRRSRSR